MELGVPLLSWVSRPRVGGRRDDVARAQSHGVLWTHSHRERWVVYVVAFACNLLACRPPRSSVAIAALLGCVFPPLTATWLLVGPTLEFDERRRTAWIFPALGAAGWCSELLSSRAAALSALPVVLADLVDRRLDVFHWGRDLVREARSLEPVAESEHEP